MIHSRSFAASFGTPSSTHALIADPCSAGGGRRDRPCHPRPSTTLRRQRRRHQRAPGGAPLPWPRSSPRPNRRFRRSIPSSSWTSPVASARPKALPDPAGADAATVPHPSGRATALARWPAPSAPPGRPKPVITSKKLVTRSLDGIVHTDCLWGAGEQADRVDQPSVRTEQSSRPPLTLRGIRTWGGVGRVRVGRP